MDPELQLEKIRLYTCGQYLKYTESQETAEKLELETFNISKERTDEISQENTDTDLEKYQIQAYLQTYIKVFTYFNTHKKSKPDIDVLSIPRLPREVICPEKWIYMKNVRNNDSVIIKKKGIHRCPKCKSWYTNYQQLQTSSADESMRVSVVCMDCNWHWKYS